MKPLLLICAATLALAGCTTSTLRSSGLTSTAIVQQCLNTRDKSPRMEDFCGISNSFAAPRHR